jgi:hypothetical protein
MADDVVRGVSDNELQTVLEDLSFQDFDVVQKVKGSDGLWAVTVRKKAGAAAAPVSPAPVAAGAVVPDAWMPDCAMKRIICHWTAGAYSASTHDRACYHILIQHDGTLIRGDFSIADNVSAADKRYARHTKNCNTGSIGISVCCMAEANEAPFRGGGCPMTMEQWELLVRVTAQLAKRYRIPVTPTTILGHGEVQTNLGIAQEQKWDPMVLPWDLNASKEEVGRRFRAKVSELLAHP